MAYTPIVTVAISLDTAAVSRASFGTPIFITENFWFTERVRTYTDIDAVADDVPTDSDAYLGALKAFSQDIPPKFVKLGRREADEITLTAAAATAIGQTYAVTVVDTANVTTTATFTSVTGAETGITIVADLVADLAAVTGITVTDNLDGTFELAKSGTDDFAITNITRLTYAYSTTESAADALTAISAEDDDYYFVACNDHTDAFVMAMAAQVEALTKIYFVALQDSTNLGVYSEVATDTMSKLAQNEYDRTTAWYHDTADTTFPEMAFIAVAAPADPGKKVWGDNRVATVSASKDVSTGLVISTTQKNNLVAKNANFTETVGGIVITRQGTVASGNWIDEIRDRDFLESRTKEALQDLLIRTPKLPYTDAGIARVENALASTYSRYVETQTQPNILQAGTPYIITLPRRKDVAFSDITARSLSGEVVLYLTGSILSITINGSATYNAEI